MHSRHPTAPTNALVGTATSDAGATMAVGEWVRRYGSGLPAEAVADGEHIDTTTQRWALLLTALYWAAAPAGAALFMHENRRALDYAHPASVVATLVAVCMAIVLIALITLAASPDRAALRRGILTALGSMTGIAPLLIATVAIIVTPMFGGTIHAGTLLALGLSLAGAALLVGIGVGIAFPKAAWSRYLQGAGAAALLASIWIPFGGESLIDTLTPSRGSRMDLMAQVAAMAGLHVGTLGPLATALFVRHAKRLDGARVAFWMLVGAHAMVVAALIVLVLDSSSMSFWQLWAILTAVLCWLAGVTSVGFGLSTLFAQRAWAAYWRRRIAPDRTAEAGTLEATLLALEREREQGEIDEVQHRAMVQAALTHASSAPVTPDTPAK